MENRSHCGNPHIMLCANHFFFAWTQFRGLFLRIQRTLALSKNIVWPLKFFFKKYFFSVWKSAKYFTPLYIVFRGTIFDLKMFVLNSARVRIQSLKSWNNPFIYSAEHHRIHYLNIIIGFWLPLCGRHNVACKLPISLPAAAAQKKTLQICHCARAVPFTTTTITTIPGAANTRTHKNDVWPKKKPQQTRPSLTRKLNSATLYL